MNSRFSARTPLRWRLLLRSAVALAFVTSVLAAITSGCNDDSPVSQDLNKLESTRASLGAVTRHYCGVIDPNQPADFSVHLYNHSSQPLKITQANVSCGCLSLLDVPESIPPKDTAELHLEWDAAHSSGFRQQRILVLTDSADPTRSLFQIEVSASVRSAWSSPESVDFGRVCLADDPHRDFVVSVLGYERVQFEKVESDSPYFNAQFGDQSRQQVDETSPVPTHVQHDQSVNVRLTEHSSFGQISGTIRVSLVADGKQLTSTVPVLAEVTGLVRCVPPQVVWANAVGGQELRTTVRVKCSPNKVINLSRIEFQADTSAIAVRKVKSSSEDVVVLITMTIPPDRPKGQLRGYVSGMIGEQEVFRLPVLAIVQR